MDKISQLKSTMQATKIDDYTLSVTSTPVTPAPITQTYDRTFLENQLVAIQAQLDAFTQARQAELDEVNALLALCDEQGVISRPIESDQTPDNFGAENLQNNKTVL